MRTDRISWTIAFCLILLFLCPSRSAEALEPAVEGGAGGRISDFEARLTLARLLSYRSDRIEEAVREYRILLKERPKEIGLRIELAQLLMRQKKFGEAAGELQKVLATKPTDPTALATLARVYLWTGRNEEAAKVFSRLEKPRTVPPDILRDMARAYTWSKEYERAAGIYEMLLESPGTRRSDLYVELGNVRLYGGRLPQAIECYRKALKIDPDFLTAQRQLALALSWEGRYEEAMPLLARIHQQDPMDVKIAVAMARAFTALDRHTEAVSTIEGLRGLDLRAPDLLADLADLEAEVGHAAKCRELYLKALSLAENKEPILLRYAARMNLWGDFYRVESIYRQHLVEHPSDLDIISRLAWVLVSAERYEEAEGMYLRLLRQDPRWGKGLVDLARLRILEKDFHGSLGVVDRLLVAEPHNPEGLFVKGEALYHAGRYGEALAVYELLTRVEPNQVRGALALAGTYRKLGNRKEAERYLIMALQLDPRSAEARFYLAGEDRASISGSKARAVEPGRESPATLTEWGRLYAASGNRSQALSSYEEALRKDPEYFPARMGLVEVLAADHQYDRAEQTVKELAEEFPDASKILITQARVLGWGRHFDQALAVYDRVCKLNPSDPVPRREKARTAAWGKRMDLAERIYAEAYRVPVDRVLATSIEALVHGANDPGLSELFIRLRYAAEKGSIYEAYERFYRELAELSGSLPDEVSAGLEEIRSDLLPSYRIQKAAYLEGRSKLLAWNLKFTRALESYEELIGFEPGNEEALFDYAQVECSLGLCDREAVTYERLLAVDPLHPLAGMAVKRQQIRSEPSVALSHSYWDEEGRGGLSQIRRNRTDLTLDIPLSCRYHLSLTAHHWLEDPKMKGISYDAFGPTIALHGVWNEFVSGEVSYTNKQYTESNVDSTHTGFAHLWFNLMDKAKLGVGYDRSDELYNNFGIRQSVQADSFWLDASSHLTRELEVRGKAQYLSYNDGNTGQVCTVTAGYAFTEHPGILKLILGGEYRETEHEHVFHYQGDDLVNITHPYWTPEDYLATAATLEWHHDISKLFFCGSELHFYDLRVGAGTDTDDNPFIRLEGGWHYEFKDLWTLDIKGLFHRSREWDATGAWATLRCKF